MPSAETPAGDDTAAPTQPFIPPPPFPWRAVSRSAVLATLLSLACAAVLGFGQYYLLTALHVDTKPLQRDLPLSALVVLAGIFIAPPVETLLMAAVIGLLRRASRSRAFVISASGVLWGAAHAAYGLLSLLPTGAVFAILTMLYLRWRPHSFAAAYWSAAWAHALYNASLFAIAFMFSNT